MRTMIRLLFLWVVMLAYSSMASYDTMPAPPPNMPASTAKPGEDKAKVKRGVHWYRSPACETAAKQLEYAFNLYEKESFRKAANAYQALVYAWPDSPEATKAQLALAQVQEHRLLYDKAFDEYQYLFDYYPGQFDYREVLDRQFKIANYLMTTPKGAFLFFHGFQAPERALPLFEKIIRNAPAWERAPTAQLNIGIIHEMNDEYEEAVVAYEILQNRYNDENLLAQASFREAHCLYQIYTDRPNNEDSCNAARASLVQYIRTYPRHEKIEEARTFLLTLNTQQAIRSFEQARYYDRIAHRPKSALIAYEEFLKKYSSLNQELTTIARERVESLKKETPHEKK